MRIKRYFGKSIREVIQKVREEQGPEAVILSNRKVDGGVEIVAAIDFEEVLLEAEATRATPPPRPERGDERLPSVLYRAPHASPSGVSSNRHRPASARSSASAERVAVRPEQTERYLVEVQRELRSLRGVVEQQLLGLVWGDIARRNPLQAELLQSLTRLELGPALCRQLADELTASETQAAWREALAHLAHRLPVADDDIITRGGAVALVGPTGVGKTTTIAKLAARFAMRHGTRQIALVTTDNYRIGAHDQLRTYAKLLGIPMRIAADAADLDETLKELAQKRLVLIDTAGMSQRDVRLGEQFTLLGERSGLRNYLVLATNTREATLDEVIRTYAGLRPVGCILTKADEVGSLGGVLTLLIKYRLAVAYVSDGQRVPEDLHAARAHNLVARSVAMMRRAARDEESTLTYVH